MVKFPIHLTRSSYRGADSRKREKASEQNRIASELEVHINGLLKAQKSPIQEYGYYEIASNTGHPVETVRRLCFSIDCGHNGFTVVRSDLTIDQALKLVLPANK